MSKEKYVTKEYFHNEIKEIRASMYITLDTILKSQSAYHETLMARHMGALQEGFSDKVRGAMDGITMLLEKSENHEGRICKIEEVMI